MENVIAKIKAESSHRYFYIVDYHFSIHPKMPKQRASLITSGITPLADFDGWQRLEAEMSEFLRVDGLKILALHKL